MNQYGASTIQNVKVRQGAEKGLKFPLYSKNPVGPSPRLPDLRLPGAGVQCFTLKIE